MRSFIRASVTVAFVAFVALVAGCAAGSGGSSSGSGAGSGGGASAAGGSAGNGGNARGARCAAALALAGANGAAVSGVSSAGACAGLSPVVPACATDLAVCDGEQVGSSGPSGDVTGAGQSDGQGALALQCTSVDAGPSPGFTLFGDGAAGYSKGVQLGAQVWGLPAGFVSLSGSGAQRTAAWFDFYDHGGARLGDVPQNGGVLLASAATLEFVTAEPVAAGQQVFAQQVGHDGAPAGPRVALSDVLPAGSGVYLGGAADAAGGTLVFWSVYGHSGTTARWLDQSGQPASPAFALDTGGAAYPLAAGLLAGQGVAIGNGVEPAQWTGIVAPGATAVTPAPAWLSSRRGSIALVRGGRALAFTQRFAKTVEVLAADGSSCGTLTVPGAASVGTDGTVFSALDGRTFRVFPQALQ